MKTLLFQSVDQVASARLGDDQTPRGVHGTAAYDLLPHVPGDGDHGVSVERGEQIIHHNGTYRPSFRLRFWPAPRT